MKRKTRVLIAGGSGFLGRLLADRLVKDGHEVIILTRSPRPPAGPVRFEVWDGRTVGPWRDCLAGADAVVNLAGRNVNCRYTPGNKLEINESRVLSVQAVGEAIRQCVNPPRVWIQAGSLAVYGDAGDRWCDETSPPGEGFPVETCLLWERAFNEMSTPHTRKVLLRISFVLGGNGGALGTLAGLTRRFLGGTVGTGRQYVSWIHWKDMNELFLWAMKHEEAAGVFNATSPNPVTNAELMRELRRALRRPWSPPTPVWAVRLGSWLMRTESCLALTGRRGTPARLLEDGFSFGFPTLREALGEIYPAGRRASSAPRCDDTE